MLMQLKVFEWSFVSFLHATYLLFLLTGEVTSSSESEMQIMDSSSGVLRCSFRPLRLLFETAPELPFFMGEDGGESSSSVMS